jgi:glycosyltransferase involved in cell wall biosynthesis/SAM-dependent methyltransferase
MKRVVDPNHPEPYLSFCLVVRNCERTLEATLKSIRERTPKAEIVIVDTCSTDRTIEISQKYADVWEQYRGPRGDWSEEMLAVDDMSVARQRSFELAHGRWRAWADGDDRIVGGEEAERYLKLNGRWKPTPRGHVVVDGDKEAASTATATATLAPAKPTLDTIKGEDGAVDLEDFLRWLEKNQPEVTMLWCPYLYQRDEKDNALSWLERERIVRWDNPPKFRWAEPAHEVLVPIGRYLPPRVDLPHLLWVHEKIWTGEEYEYSYKRHSAIMLKQYEEGDVTFRRCRYLVGFARAYWPHRELEFLKKAHEVAFTPLDRYRALIDLGNYYARRGLFWDSYEAHGAAVELRSDLPDAWYNGAQVAFDNEDYAKAVLWLRRGVACEIATESEVNPREHKIKYPTLLNVALQRVAEQNVKMGLHDNALAFFQEAAEVSGNVRSRSEVGGDEIEAQAYFIKARNKWLGQKAVMALREVKNYLCNNDEPEKALALIEAFPHNADDHPIKVELEAWAHKIRKHIQDPKAYDAFYNSAMETGYVPMHPSMYTYENSHYRVKWLIDTIKALLEQTPGITVADIGSCDGIIGVPLLLTCPRLNYTAFDVNAEAIEKFKGMLDHYNIAWRGSETIKLVQQQYPAHGAKFDVLVVGEIIEHVPDPVVWLRELKRHLTPTGVLLCTTPWGGFDDGHPPLTTAFGTPRDNRGHLRAYSPQAAYRDFIDAGFDVSEITRLGGSEQSGQAMVIRAKAAPMGPVGSWVSGLGGKKSPVAFVVPGALWQWNGSKVDREGIGASEEMIIRLGEYQGGYGAKTQEGTRNITVYGPVPEQEVYKHVAYFNLEALRNVSPWSKIVVSRSPHYGKKVDEALAAIGRRPQPKILWLQDTIYSDLNAEVADTYESIVVVSNWHKELTLQAHGLRPEQADKIHVAYNFLQKEHFLSGAEAGWEGIKADPKKPHFIYASSPDRGVLKLLKLWPRVLEKYPEATLSIFYGWKGAAKLGNGVDSVWNQRYLTHRREYEVLRHQKGVIEHGMVNHLQLALEYQRASGWLYPTVFAETGCLSACKARAAGAVPVTSAYAALNETARCEQATLLELDHDKPNPVTGEPSFPEGYDDAFIEGVVKAVEMPTEQRQAMALEAIEDFSYEAIKPIWDKLLDA